MLVYSFGLRVGVFEVGFGGDQELVFKVGKLVLGIQMSSIFLGTGLGLLECDSLSMNKFVELRGIHLEQSVDRLYLKPTFVSSGVGKRLHAVLRLCLCQTSSHPLHLH